MGGREEAREISSRLFITLLSLPLILFTAATEGLLGEHSRASWQMWPVLIMLASLGLQLKATSCEHPAAYAFASALLSGPFVNGACLCLPDSHMAWGLPHHCQSSSPKIA